MHFKQMYDNVTSSPNFLVVVLVLVRLKIDLGFSFVWILILMFDSLRGGTCLHCAAYYGHSDCVKSVGCQLHHSCRFMSYFGYEKRGAEGTDLEEDLYVQVRRAALCYKEVGEKSRQECKGKHRGFCHMSITDLFSLAYLLDCLDVARKGSMSSSKSSWDMVKDLMAYGDINEMLASKQRLLLCWKQRYPGLSQTMLVTCKIQYNRQSSL